MRILLLITVLGLALLFFSSCSDDDPSAPQPETPYRLTAPLQNAVVDVPLTANQPTNVKLTLHLPPEIPLVTSAEIDIAGTLDHVSVDGIPLWALIARKVSHLFGKADEIGATATLRVGSDPATVCEAGVLYGPFEVSHGTTLVVSPETVVADETALQIINSGSMVICLTIVPNIDALLSVDAVAMDITEGRCDSPANFAGTWTGTYECGNSCLGPFGGNIQLTVSQTGTEASYTDQGGDTFTGVVCGDMFRFEYVGEGFFERGTLTLDGPNAATKRSTWRESSPPYCGGDCVDYLTRQVTTECPSILVSSGAPPDGTVGQSYFFQATATGGQGGLTLWAIPAETIPGLEYGDNGVLAGTPIAAALGTWNIQVTIYDHCEPEPQIVNQTYTITIGE